MEDVTNSSFEKGQGYFIMILIFEDYDDLFACSTMNMRHDSSEFDINSQ